MTGRMPDGVHREHSMREAVTERKQMKAILVKSHDVLLQITFWNIVHPSIIFHLAGIDGRVLENLFHFPGTAIFHKSRNVICMEMRQVNKPNGIRIHVQSRKTL